MLYGNYDILSYDGYQSKDEHFTIDAKSFDDAYGFGFYLYIDAIPVIDIDLEGNLLISPYEFSFSNKEKKARSGLILSSNETANIPVIPIIKTVGIIIIKENLMVKDGTQIAAIWNRHQNILVLWVK